MPPLKAMGRGYQFDISSVRDILVTSILNQKRSLTMGDKVVKGAGGKKTVFDEKTGKIKGNIAGEGKKGLFSKILKNGHKTESFSHETPEDLIEVARLKLDAFKNDKVKLEANKIDMLNLANSLPSTSNKALPYEIEDIKNAIAKYHGVVVPGDELLDEPFIVSPIVDNDVVVGIATIEYNEVSGWDSDDVGDTKFTHTEATVTPLVLEENWGKGYEFKAVTAQGSKVVIHNDNEPALIEFLAKGYEPSECPGKKDFTILTPKGEWTFFGFHPRN